MAAEKLFSAREAAQFLDVSYPTLKLWIYKKKIGTIKMADIIAFPKTSSTSFCIEPLSAATSLKNAPDSAT